jgi:chemotaxis protein MotB
VKLLIEQYDISADRLSAAGYAEFHPVSANDNAKGRQLNRRVDVVILRSGHPQKKSEEEASAASVGALTVP